MGRRSLGRAAVPTAVAALGLWGAPSAGAAVTVKLADVLPLSGASAGAGQAAAKGARLAIEQANASHLVRGVRFALVDDSDVGPGGVPDAAAGAAMMRRLAADGQVAGVVAPYDTATALAELPIANQASLATVSPSATGTCLTLTAALGCSGAAAELSTVQPTGRTTFFRVAPADFLQEQFAADFLSTGRFLHTAYVIDDATAAGTVQATAFAARFALDGGVVTGRVSTVLGSSFANLLARVAAVRPDLVVYGGDSLQTGLALRRQMATTAGLGATPLLVSSALDTPAFAQSAGAGGTVWAPAAAPALDRLPSAAVFAKQFTARFGTPSTAGARGYDAAEALLQAVKAAVAAGAKPPTGAKSSAASFRTAVVAKIATAAFTGADGAIAFSPNGDLRQGPVEIDTLAGATGWVGVTVGQVTEPPATAALAPAALDFGSVPIHGGSADLSLQLVNTGIVPFRARTIAAGGSGFSVASETCTGANIVAGAHCTLTIRFAPAATGPSKVLLTVTDPADSSPQTATLLGIGVTPPPLAIAPPALPEGAVGVAYRGALTARGGVAPYHWSVVAGALPPGVTLNAADGTLTGTPASPGRFGATLKVTDSATSAPQTTTAPIAITIAPPVPAAVYAGNGGNSSVRAFALTATGDTGPLTTLAGADTQLNGTAAVALTAVGGLLVADANTPAVTEYAPGASGDARPTAVLSGPDTGLAAPQALALAANGDLYVANRPAGTVTVYPPGAAGDSPPIRTISGLVAPSGLAFAHNGDLWIASSQANTLSRYDAGADGAATPFATIAGPDTALNAPQGLAVDPAGDVLTADEFSEAITGYAADAHGDTPPSFSLAGSHTGLSFPVGVDLDTQGDLYVSNASGSTITAYPPGARGDTAPARTIAGAATGLAAPGRLAVTPPLIVLTRRLPAGRAGRRYHARLWAALGTRPLHWRIRHLPAGLRLAGPTGTISGTPRRRGTVHVRVTVRDGAHPAARATRTLALTIRAPASGRHPRA